MNRSNGYRSPRKMFASDLNGCVDYLGETTIGTMHASSSSSTKTVKSSTLNRHHLNKPKSPGRKNNRSSE
jgi:hypothetical protein